VPLELIDPHIKPLVDCLNQIGCTTFASCQGHGGFTAMRPYVAFISPIERAKRLERMLRDAQESEDSLLHFGWYIRPFFNQDYELVYALDMNPRKHFIYRATRRWVDRDIRTIQQLLASESTQNLQNDYDTKKPPSDFS
jgi:hypothetical protein